MKAPSPSWRLLRRGGRAEAPSRRPQALCRTLPCTTRSLIFYLPDSSVAFTSTFVSSSDYHFHLANPTSAVEHRTVSRLSPQPRPVGCKIRAGSHLPTPSRSSLYQLSLARRSRDSDHNGQLSTSGLHIDLTVAHRQRTQTTRLRPRRPVADSRNSERAKQPLEVVTLLPTVNWKSRQSESPNISTTSYHVMQQPTALTPYSQIRAGGGVLFPPHLHHRKVRITDGQQQPIIHSIPVSRARSCSDTQCSAKSVEQRRYNGAQLVGQESQRAEQKAQPTGQEAPATEGRRSPLQQVELRTRFSVWPRMG